MHHIDLPHQTKHAIMTNLLALVSLSRLLSASLLLALALLQKGLRDQDIILGGDGTVGTLRLVRSPRAVTSRLMDGQSAGWRIAN